MLARLWLLALAAIAWRWPYSRAYFWVLGKLSDAIDWGPELADNEGEMPW